MAAQLRNFLFSSFCLYLEETKSWSSFAEHVKGAEVRRGWGTVGGCWGFVRWSGIFTMHNYTMSARTQRGHKVCRNRKHVETFSPGLLWSRFIRMTLHWVPAWIMEPLQQRTLSLMYEYAVLPQTWAWNQSSRHRGGSFRASTPAFSFSVVVGEATVHPSVTDVVQSFLPSSSTSLYTLHWGWIFNFTGLRGWFKS